MDALASDKVHDDFRDAYDFIIQLENTGYSKCPQPIKARNKVIKFARLPEHDLKTKEILRETNKKQQPRFRRIVTINDSFNKSSRSLNLVGVTPSKVPDHIKHKRKIASLSQSNENDMHPVFSKERVLELKQDAHLKSKPLTVDLMEGKQNSQKTTSRLSCSAKYSRDSKPGAKTNNVTKKETKSQSNFRVKQTNCNVTIESRTKKTREKEVKRCTNSIASSRIDNNHRASLAKNSVQLADSEKDLVLFKKKLYHNIKNKLSPTTQERIRGKKPCPPHESQSGNDKVHMTPKSNLLIRVPLDDKRHKHNVIESNLSLNTIVPSISEITRSDCSTGTDIIEYQDVNLGTEPQPLKVNQMTCMDNLDTDIIYKQMRSTDVQAELIKETFDNLDIPNVTLNKDKSEENSSIQIPSISINSINLNKETPPADKTVSKSTSYIVSRATLTYTTEQEINFQVVDANDNKYSNQSASRLVYPVNVMSVIKKQMSAENISNSRKNEVSNKEVKLCANEKTFVPDTNKLIKPSNLISSISVNNSLIQSKYMCEQFQRELNFIDSFFESLHYLESSLSNKPFKHDKIDLFVKNPKLLESEFNERNSDYDNFFSKLGNSTDSDDAETMTSKNLFLLNILIRDEQRRAKNLLFVLKKREDALKDFTKSQILYLENKKKQDNTDISALKKKQRGALLKLQHECGEMQRMRKALLTLSEKRKVALMKTKRDLELKLKNNLDVEQIFLGKKKLKRNPPVDRSATAPLKCFDLSSSGCEDSTSSRGGSDAVVSESAAAIEPVRSVEKSIQTGESIFNYSDVSTDTTAENFIAVDGGYLNILFHNISLPQIFSSGKQYEVNECALKNIVSTANAHNGNKQKADMDRSSTPSTARSLVDEFDHYYKVLVEEDKSSEESSSDIVLQASSALRCCEIQTTATSMNFEAVPEAVMETAELACEPLALDSSDKENESLAGPLPVPVGAADVTDPPIQNATDPGMMSWLSHNLSPSASSASSNTTVFEVPPSLPAVTAPVHTEAEELRKKQLAIEREIKELEQQQCRLLVVREIPDKPPPPYTPPTDVKPNAPRLFKFDNSTEQNIREFMENNNDDSSPDDSFDEFVQDFCQETMERNKPEQSEKPWDSCNLQPQKPGLDFEKLINQTSAELSDVLSGASSNVVSGVSARRSDHIDDILFTDWRRVETNWTSLHNEETIVKNQLFETIFQRILSETVDEFKKNVFQTLNQ